MLIEEMTMPEFEEGLKITRTVFIPFGSVEQHGPHLPLSTDTIEAIEIGRRVAEHIPLFVAPPIHYGNCRSTSCHPGTISISTDTLKGLFTDIVCSLHSQGLRQFVALTGHAGGAHRLALQEAGEALAARFQDSAVAVLTEYELVLEVAGDLVETAGDAHAGEIETSRIMHTHPHLVKGSAPREFPSFPAGIMVRDKRRFWPGGVWGDPGKASAEKGRQIEERVVQRVIQVIAELERYGYG